VIDESHNFRNNTKGKRDETGQLVRLSRYERLMQDIICSGVKTKVMLLSATPVNNTLTDLRNQMSVTKICGTLEGQVVGERREVNAIALWAIIGRLTHQCATGEPR
jgi:hypothetical protein